MRDGHQVVRQLHLGAPANTWVGQSWTKKKPMLSEFNYSESEIEIESESHLRLRLLAFAPLVAPIKSFIETRAHD